MDLAAPLVRHLPTLLLRHFLTVLSGDALTVLVRDLFLLLLLDVPALVVGIVLTRAGDRSPHLVVACALPLVLTVLLVVRGALCLSVVLQLLLVLGAALLLILSGALLLVHSLTLLSGGGDTLVLVGSLTLGHLDCDAILGLCLYVLGVPDHLVLRPALDTGLGLAGGGVSPTSPSILRGPHH